MCGIVGINGKGNVSKQLYQSIKKLEYRGYDSVGMATTDTKSFEVRKDVGNIDTVNTKVKFQEMKGNIGITHTRWATHGGVSKENSHPHSNSDETIFVVHNGIIENNKQLRQDLENKGYKFKSETDTEIIPHYFEEKLKSKSVNEAIIDFMNEIDGTYAILLLIKGHENIYAIKKDSPLALGIAEGMNILASDIYAFNSITEKSIFFDDNEFAIIGKDNYQFYDNKGNAIEKEIKEIELEKEQKSDKEYPHHMIKEIEEQPFVAKRLIDSFELTQKEAFQKFADLIGQKKKVAFIACGTSYHASLIGVSILRKAGIESQSVVASEWEHFIKADKDTFVIAISQSGETMDVVVPLKKAKEAGATIGSIVNVPYSTIQRHSDVSINILAGAEVAVASTKAFTNTNIALFQIANMLGYSIDIESIPAKLEETLNQRDACKKVAAELFKKRDIYVLGRRFGYPIAREVALKLKEVDYIHAEGMMAGELKHGTLALIEEGVPVISLVYNHNPEMLSSNQEVKARGAKVYVIGNLNTPDFKVPDCDISEFAIYSTMIGHLLSYEIGILKGTEIDQCRNLAKSVTVL